MNNTIAKIRKHLDRIEELFELQEKKSANDIRRKLINDEIVEIERQMVQIRYRNQQSS